MQSTHTALLPFPQLPLAARRAHVLLALQNKALLSICQFCDSNFTAVFRKGQVKLSNEDNTITVKRDSSTGLYYIDLPEPQPVAPQTLHPFFLQRILNENQGRAVPIPTPVCLQSSHAYLDQRHRCRIFRYLARPNLRTGAYTPPQVSSNCKRTPQTRPA